MYGEASALYDEWTRCYDPANIEMGTINRYISFDNKKILEIGCGTGRFTNRIAYQADSIVAIDNDQDSINIASQKDFPRSVVFKNLDALEICSENVGDNFDIVVFSWSLNYIDDKETAIKKATNLLKKDGFVIVLYTAYGEYEKLLAEVSGTETINDEQYDLVKHYISDYYCCVKEDHIITPFVFRNIEDAVRLNIFFYNDDNSIMQRMHQGMLPYVANNDSIVIYDTVNLLIGGCPLCSI